MSVETLPHGSPELDVMDEVAQVRHFQESLTAISTTKVVETSLYLDTEDPIGDAVQRFMTYEHEAATGMYINPAQAELQQAGEVTFVPRQSRAGKHSKHNVFFGDLLFENGATMRVAVKPHNIDADTSCVTDYLTTVGAEQLAVETIKPVGMVMGRTGINYSITKLEAIDTLDNVEWQGALSAETRDEEMLAVWGQVGRQAAMLHSLGSVKHGDLAARNIAMRPDGSIFFIDWEHAKMSTRPPRDAEASYVHSRADIGELMESMVRPIDHHYKAGIGLLSEQLDPWEDFKQLVFNEYVAMRMGFAEQNGTTYEVRDELGVLENSLKAHMRLLLTQQ